MPILACINGSPRLWSRTGALVGHLAKAIEARLSVQRHDVAFADAGASVVSGLERSCLSANGEKICRQIELADILIVGSPVYRASYSGLMKHLFDLLDRDAMRGKIAVLAATGASPLHGLMIEHQMRPLMGFFAINTAATTIYALEDEIEPHGFVAPAVARRIAQAAEEITLLTLAIRPPSHGLFAAA